ncbi:hypothetical protein PHYSODRAFT_409967, partial [Phytophthora sojae]
MKFSVLASLLIAGVFAECPYQCAINNGHKAVCGSNGVTYENLCYFNKANDCPNMGWEVLH